MTSDLILINLLILILFFLDFINFFIHSCQYRSSKTKNICYKIYIFLSCFFFQFESNESAMDVLEVMICLMFNSNLEILKSNKVCFAKNIIGIKKINNQILNSRSSKLNSTKHETSIQKWTISLNPWRGLSAEPHVTPNGTRRLNDLTCSKLG